MGHRRLAAAAIALAVVAAALAGSAPPPALPGAAAVYARGGRLWLEALSAGGRPSGPPVLLGRLGLVGQWNVAAPWRGGVAVALGGRVAGWRGGRVQTLARAPRGCAILAVAAGPDHLWHLTGCPAAGRLEAAAPGRRAVPLPVGLPYLFAGPGGHPMVLLTRPRDGELVALSGPWQGWRCRLPLPPVGTAAWNGRAVLVPLWAGQGRVRLARAGFRGPVTLGPAVAPARAPLAVGGRPVWAFTPAGPEPPGRPRALVPWPVAPPAPALPAGSAGGWLLIQDGFGQGLWFRPAGGRWGGSLEWRLPPGAVGRALIPYPSSGR